MDAFELLEADHRKVEGLFEQLEPTTERAVKTRQELFGKLKTELDIHTQIEETILYPVLKKISETRDITFEGYERRRQSRARHCASVCRNKRRKFQTHRKSSRLRRSAAA